MVRCQMTEGKSAGAIDNLSDDELLKQRLAAVVNIPSDRPTTGFRRRRSSGLLFQIRRKIQLHEL
jgi:hypothetical protein